MARIGIDARFVGPEGKGLGRYGEKLIEMLQELDSTNEYVIFERSYFFAVEARAIQFSKSRSAVSVVHGGRADSSSTTHCPTQD